MEDKGVVHFWQKDSRVGRVEWRDLLKASKKDVFIELILSLPWLILEFVFIFYGLWFLAIPCAFFFFLTGLRQVHGGFHRSLGLSRNYTDVFLFIMSGVMLGAMHAVKFNHLEHHKRCMSEHDIEAKSAHMSALGALAFGPVFPFLLHWNALKNGNKLYRRWIVLELVFNAFVVAIACFWPLFLSHVILMAIAQCLTAFFAVWTVHRDCNDGDFVFARTQRGRIKNLISYDMFFHMEHHLFPAVPQRNLHIVAKRLDEAVPELTQKNVF